MHILQPAAAAIFGLLSFPGPGWAAAPGRAVVIKSVVNMYSAPDESVDVVSQAILGTNVRITEVLSDPSLGAPGWFRVETPDAYRGWVAGAALRSLGETEPEYASEGSVFEVTSLFANVYATGDVTERKPVVTATIGARLAAGACGDRWCEVTLPDGGKGWVQTGDGSAGDALAPRRKLAPDETVALSKRFLGLPYLWGGTTPYGFDCSGFVQLLYHLSGIEILRDADVQMTGSGLSEVPPGSETARDLVFFGPAKDKITHVGMMIGPTDFINATTHGRPLVQISDLGDPYWKKLYQGARRSNK
jgi:gamma-D-glutamyl-L-lysine dipeptidyl-peptidase